MNRDLLSREDLVSSLKNSGEKIAVYGMGNGAAKLIDVLNRNGLGCSAVFASDGFVRGQEFLGHKVLTLSQTEEILGDFTVLVGFASDLPEVISKIKSLQKRHRTLIPEINVYGDHSKLFDLEYFNERFIEFSRLYDALSDEMSRRFFVSLVNFKLTGDPDFLWELDLLSADRTDDLYIRSYADLGAYDGDTLNETLSKHPELINVLAFEPNEKAFIRLSKTAKRFDDRLEKAILINAAAGEGDSQEFFSGQGRGSAVLSDSVCPGVRYQKPKICAVRTLDTVVEENNFEKVDLIKFDVEGFERSALAGAMKTLGSQRPSVEMSVYHNRDDLCDLFDTLYGIYPGAGFYLSKKRPCFPAWDVRLTVISPETIGKSARS